MNKFVPATLVLAAVLLPSALAAQSSAISEPESQALHEPSHPLALAGPVQAPKRTSDAQLTSIITWLTNNFELAPTTTLPNVKFVSATAITRAPSSRVPGRRRSTRFSTRAPVVQPSRSTN